MFGCICTSSSQHSFRGANNRRRRRRNNGDDVAIVQLYFVWCIRPIHRVVMYTWQLSFVWCIRPTHRVVMWLTRQRRGNFALVFDRGHVSDEPGDGRIDLIAGWIDFIDRGAG